MQWVLLAAVLCLFVWYLASLDPVHYFGQFHDDTIYFSSAQALAEGRGYVMPSLPGRPAQTKYPVLYPWLLSWVWRYVPSFPANLKAAIGVTALCSCWFLVAAFVMLRRLKGVGGWAALGLVSLCAFHSLFVFLSSVVLSDTLFMALGLTAVIAADLGLRERSSAAWIWLSSLLTGLCIATRPVGVAVIAGVAACAVYRRTYRRGALFCLGVAPVLLGLVAWTSAHSLRSAGGTPSDLGWIQTWSYYTSYWGFWKLSVPNAEVFRTMLSLNLQDILQTPATLCLFPPLGGEGSYAGVVLCIVLTTGIVVGAARQARSQEWKPIHFAAVFTAALILFWNYSISDRYLMLFLPLFYAGLWVEGKHLISMVRVVLARGQSVTEQAVAAAATGVLVAVVVVAADYYRSGPRPDLKRLATQRAALEPEKEQAYSWIARNTAPDARFVAYEDAKLYLHTGRQAMWPIAFSNGAFYASDASFMQRELAHLPDVARHIGAYYWLWAEGDFYRERGSALIQKRLGEWRSVLPVVFRSRGNKVLIYDLSCVVQPARAECERAVPVLFAKNAPL